ncbi:MAG: signal peptidase II [Prochlorococcus sp.]|nr:signal peptidase II [Prochlorococcaceae cyanobacterium Fu_MAG_50]
MTRRLLQRHTLILISALLVILDQLSKSWARDHLEATLTGRLVPGLLQLRLVQNTGAAFSLFSGATPILGVLSFAFALGLCVWIWRSSPLPFWQGLGAAFLLGGALGNGLDRWRLGHVTDFIQLVPIDFPVFNAADVAINLAVLCFGIDLLTRRHDQQQS